MNKEQETPEEKDNVQLETEKSEVQEIVSDTDNPTEEIGEAVVEEKETPKVEKIKEEVAPEEKETPVEETEVSEIEAVKEEAVSEKQETPAEKVEIIAEEESKPEVSEEAEKDTSKTDEKEEKPADAPAEDETIENADTKKAEEAAALYEELTSKDYSKYSKEALVDVMQELTKIDSFKTQDAVLALINPIFSKIKNDERTEALEKFIADGGDKDGFDYYDELTEKYYATFKYIKEKKTKYFKEQGQQKLANLEKANTALERLRELVDGKESTSSMNAVKELQVEWKTIGHVPPQHSKTLWANYNALMDRFYDNRSIYFELKELDRKKNHTLKSILCEKAESLEKETNLQKAINVLNELHDEYKHVGPVPRVDQESLWQRFKAASDKVYERRRAHYGEMKKDLEANLVLKLGLCEKVQEFVSFDSDRITDWNKKTKEVLELQKQWDTIGGVPREKSKDVNKPFWTGFKKFFSNKNNFFKKLDGERGENLKRKEALTEKAIALQDNTDWNKTADALKALQNDWKEIGPVPEKKRNETYAKFKAACDAFFNNRRSQFKEEEKSYKVNLKLKNEICDKIDALAKEKSTDIDQLTALQQEWNGIGFVPKKNINSSHEKFEKAVQGFVDASDMPEDEKAKFSLSVQINAMKGKPDAGRRLEKKEFSIRRKVGSLENDIALWNNNLGFFANSKNADAVKKEFDDKISKATEELNKLKAQLRMIRSIE